MQFEIKITVLIIATDCCRQAQQRKTTGLEGGKPKSHDMQG